MVGRCASGVKEYFWWVQTIHRESGMALRGGRGGHPREVVGGTLLQGHQSPRGRIGPALVRESSSGVGLFSCYKTAEYTC